MLRSKTRNIATFALAGIVLAVAAFLGFLSSVSISRWFVGLFAALIIVSGGCMKHEVEGEVEGQLSIDVSECIKIMDDAITVNLPYYYMADALPPGMPDIYPLYCAENPENGEMICITAGNIRASADFVGLQ